VVDAVVLHDSIFSNRQRPAARIPTGTGTLRVALQSLSMDKCCCADLPTELPDAYLTDVTAIAANVEEVADTPTGLLYRCLICGQWWETPVPGRGIFKRVAP
jgi:hypothetical protein